MEQLSNKIRRLRFDSGEMTQKALAEQVGISRQTMNAIENCRHSPTVSVAIRIADVFQVSVEHVFTLDYEGKPARPERPARVAVDQPQASVREPGEDPIEVTKAPQREQSDAERRAALAALKGVVGP